MTAVSGISYDPPVSTHDDDFLPLLGLGQHHLTDQEKSIAIS